MFIWYLNYGVAFTRINVTKSMYKNTVLGKHTRRNEGDKLNMHQ